MDVLKPDIVLVGGMCFRNLSKKTVADQNNHDVEEYNIGSLEAAEQRLEENVDQLDDDSVPVEELKDSQFQISLHVPKCLRAVVIGSKGSTKNRLIGNSGTQIIIPRESEEGPVRVIGFNKNAVLTVRKRILEVLDSARQRTECTHFVSIPCNTASVCDAFLNFKNEVLTHCGDSRGVSEDIFQSPARLHLTLAPLVLLDERERKDAERLLTKLCSEFSSSLEQKPIKFKIQGVEYMNDDPSEVHVLYGKVSQTEGDVTFQAFAESIQEALSRDLNFVVRSGRGPVKLHLTLMNTIFKHLQNEYVTETGVDTKKQREPFDGQQILSRFSDYLFGEVTVTDVHISNRLVFDDTGYYKVSAKFTFK